MKMVLNNAEVVIGITDYRDDESTISNEESDITKDITRILSTLQIAKSLCKLDGCQIPPDEFMIKCSKCDLSLHYKCTRLFICDMCVIEEMKYSGPTEENLGGGCPYERA